MHTMMPIQIYTSEDYIVTYNSGVNIGAGDDKAGTSGNNTITSSSYLRNIKVFYRSEEYKTYREIDSERDGMKEYLNEKDMAIK